MELLEWNLRRIDLNERFGDVGCDLLEVHVFVRPNGPFSRLAPPTVYLRPASPSAAGPGRLQRIVSLRTVCELTGSLEASDPLLWSTDREIVVGLEVGPELGAGPESLSQEPGSFGSDTTLAANKLVDALDRDTNVLGESHLCDAKRLDELFEKDLARMTRDSAVWDHEENSVVVDNANVVGVGLVPAKDDTPLIVDADAVATSKITSQCLEPIAGR
jgi:hypothetical protein